MHAYQGGDGAGAGGRVSVAEGWHEKQRGSPSAGIGWTQLGMVMEVKNGEEDGEWNQGVRMEPNSVNGGGDKGGRR